MSVGTSDTTVISSTKTEARNLNAIDASAAQRDDSSSAPKNRQEKKCLKSSRSNLVSLVLEFLPLLLDISPKGLKIWAGYAKEEKRKSHLS